MGPTVCGCGEEGRHQRENRAGYSPHVKVKGSNSDTHAGKGLCTGDKSEQWPRVTKETKLGETEDPVGHNKPSQQIRAEEKLWTLRNRLKMRERIYHRVGK